MQDKSGIHRLKSRSAILPLTHRCQMTILAKPVVTEAGADVDPALHAMQSITSMLENGNHPMSGSKSSSDPGLGCRMSILLSSEGETRASLGSWRTARRIFLPSLPSDPLRCEQNHLSPTQKIN